MSLRDKAIEEAREQTEKTNPECPECKSKGPWNFNSDILNKHDLKTGASDVSLIVRITCQNCGHEIEPYEMRD